MIGLTSPAGPSISDGFFGPWDPSHSIDLVAKLNVDQQSVSIVEQTSSFEHLFIFERTSKRWTTFLLHLRETVKQIVFCQVNKMTSNLWESGGEGGPTLFFKPF